MVGVVCVVCLSVVCAVREGVHVCWVKLHPFFEYVALLCFTCFCEVRSVVLFWC